MAQPPSPVGARIGIVTTRKLGGAVQRNRIKRLCRECFRRWENLIPAGLDLVVIARSGAHELSLAQVQAEWRRVERLLFRRGQEVLAQAPLMAHGSARSKPSGNETPGSELERVILTDTDTSAAEPPAIRYPKREASRPPIPRS